jgi:hypothetical protein
MLDGLHDHSKAPYRQANWQVSFLEYDLGYFDRDQDRVEPGPNPLAPDTVLTMCPEWGVNRVTRIQPLGCSGQGRNRTSDTRILRLSRSGSSPTAS